jgi:SPX domain protein involved in polyphosphate accumulation
VTHLNKSTLALDSLYKTFKPEYSNKYKDSLKYTFIRKIVAKEDSLYAQLSHKPLLSSKLKMKIYPTMRIL